MKSWKIKDIGILKGQLDECKGNLNVIQTQTSIIEQEENVDIVVFVFLKEIINYLKNINSAMELPQHRNATKKKWKPLKNRFFETFPLFLQEKRKSLKTQFLRGFLFILRRFLKFLRGFRFSPDNYF